jgi:RHH-type proline utilization regulon transcriptional repressor/proline dehydrogenase/delta 1-pyrroline-5-carboxylate dehydrogenase
LNEDLLSLMKSEFPRIEDEFFKFLYQEASKYNHETSLPGPTGESNYLKYKPKGTVLCLGPASIDVLKQTLLSLVLGNSVICQITNDEYKSLGAIGYSKNNVHKLNHEPSSNLLESDSYNAALYFSDTSSVQELILNSHEGLIDVVDSLYESWQLVKEQVVTEDTTASGGNANLLAL